MPSFQIERKLAAIMFTDIAGYAALSFSTLTIYRSKYIRYISPIYLIAAIYLYLYNSETTVMHVFDETTNESLGLVLCSIWIFILPWLNKKTSIEKVVEYS